MVSSILIIDRFSGFFAALGVTEPAYFWRPNTIPMALLSVGIFGVFRCLKLPYCPAVNVLASTTLGIYLLHDGILSGWLWRTVFRCAEHQNSRFFAFRILGAAVAIFTVGAAIDLLRQALERFILNCFSPKNNSGRKILLKDLKKKILGNRPLTLFCGMFLLYVFLGLCLSNYTAFDTNMFFGADNARAFGDITSVKSDHYRVKVHPLFLLLTQPVTLLLNGAVNRPEMSAILVEAFCGALSVCLFNAVLERKKVDRRFRNLFTFIYGFSFSIMIFATVPETFIFAGLGLLAFWWFLTVISADRGPLSKRETLLLVFFGAVCFGITLTNYVFYLVGLVYLLLCRYDIRAGAKTFFRLNVLNGFTVIAACVYQRFVWNNCPLFWTSMINGLRGLENYEETRYMNWAVNLPKTVRWIEQTVFNPLLSPNVYLRAPEAKYHPILFSGYTMAFKLLLLLFCTLLALCLTVWLAGRVKRFDLVEDGYILGLLTAYGGNLALHYIYGSGEAFMYSPHYLFYILLAGALALDRIENRAVRRAVVPGLAVFCAVEAVNNLDRYFQTARIALGTVSTSIPAVHAVKGTVLCGLFLLGAVFLWYCPLQGPKCAEGDTNACTRRLCGMIAVYGTLVLITSLLIAFNY